MPKKSLIDTLSQAFEKVFKNSNTKQKSKSSVNIFQQGLHFFLTFDKFELDEIEFYQKLMDSEKDVYELFVVRQNHKDGSVHMHALISYKKQKKLVPTHFDYIGKHPNIQKLRNRSAAFDYLDKQNVPYSTTDFWQRSLTANFHKTAERMLTLYLKDRIKYPYSPAYIFTKYSHYIADKPLNYLDNLLYKIQTQNHKLDQLNKKGIQEITIQSILSKNLSETELSSIFKDISKTTSLDDLNAVSYTIINYINKIMYYKNTRPKKADNPTISNDSKILSITAPSNYGKGTLTNKLRKYISSYLYPLDGWFDGYQNNVFWLIIYNEWTIEKNYQNKFKFFENEEVNLPIKGSKTAKSDSPSIILTSQLSVLQHVERSFPVKMIRSGFEYIPDPLEFKIKQEVLSGLRNRIDEVIITENSQTLFTISKLIEPL